MDKKSNMKQVNFEIKTSTFEVSTGIYIRLRELNIHKPKFRRAVNVNGFWEKTKL